MLREVNAIIRSSKWKATSEALRGAGFLAMTRQRVYGRGRQKGLRYPSADGSLGGIPVLPKWMLSIVVEDADVDAVVEALMASNRSGEIGDGKIFITRMDGALRLSDMKRDAEALDMTLPQESGA